MIVKFTNATGGAMAALDTSDRSGGYFTELPPGIYQAAFSLPPFTDPASVTLKPLTRITDDEGHFAFPAKAGEYLINVTHNGKSLAAPVAVSVTKSAELPNVVLAGGSPIRRARTSHVPKNPSKHIDAKGARVSPDSPRRTYRIQGLAN